MPMHVGHVALRVTDLECSVRHAQATLGLRETARSGATAYLTANAKHHELQLIQAVEPGLDHIGLEVESELELDELAERLADSDATVLDRSGEAELGIGRALRCVAPGGVVFELYEGMQREPLSPANVVVPLARKLGHVTLFSDRKSELEGFAVDVLGFRVSDRVGDFGTWMRCDADHHGLAVGQAPSGTRMHHYAFELESWAAIGHYADHLSRLGQRFVWGPGRHGPGFNLFTYAMDPDGAVVEAYADLLRIDNDAAYEPIDWSHDPGALNLWGPAPPDGWDDLGVPALAPAVAPLPRTS